MTPPMVTFLLPDGTEAPVGPGGLVGRMSSAALFLDDPRVSEAHAMVSLRGGELHLLALRGGLSVGRRKVARVTLRPGLQVELVPDLAVTVVGLSLPTHVVALGWAGEPPVPLAASAYTLDVKGGVRLEPGAAPEADANLWSTAGDGWRLRLRGQPTRRLAAGDGFDIDGTRFVAVEVPSAAAGVAPTLASPGAAGRALTVVLRYDTVHVHAEGGLSLHVAGIPARALTELGRFAAPVPWEMVARDLWAGETDRVVLRRNWDRHLKALRAKLREGGVRDDLVRADGLGNVELFLQPGDKVEDES